MITLKRVTRQIAATLVSGFVVAAYSTALADVVNVPGINGKDHRNVVVSNEAKPARTTVSTSAAPAPAEAKVVSDSGINQKEHKIVIATSTASAAGQKTASTSSATPQKTAELFHDAGINGKEHINRVQ